MDIKIAGKVFNWERELSTPAARRKTLADPANEQLIRQIQADPKRFGLEAADVEGIVR